MKDVSFRNSEAQHLGKDNRGHLVVACAGHVANSRIYVFHSLKACTLVLLQTIVFFLYRSAHIHSFL